LDYVIVFFELGVDLVDELLPFGGEPLVSLAALQGGRVLALLVGCLVHAEQFLFKLAQLVLSVEKNAAMEPAIFAAYEEVFVTVQESGEAWIAERMVIDCKSLSIH
jgi:hypothetical protein